MKKSLLFIVLTISSISAIAQSSEVWTIKAPMPTARANAGAVVLRASLKTTYFSKTNFVLYFFEVIIRYTSNIFFSI